MTRTSQNYIAEAYKLATKHNATFHQTPTKSWFKRVGWDDLIVDDTAYPERILNDLKDWVEANTKPEFEIQDKDDGQ